MNLIKLYKRHLDNKPLNAMDINIFWQQLALLISSGFPILKCCEALEKNQPKTSWRILIYSIKKEILAGKSLFHSLQCYPQYFDPLVCQMIKIAEHTGNLDLMMDAILQYQEKNMAIKQQIKQILFYPCFVLSIAFLLILGLFIFVIPRFSELFQPLTTQLPAITKFIFNLSYFLSKYFFIFIFMLLCFALIIFYLHKKISWKNLFYKFPFLYYYFRKIILARFARNLSLTFAAGIPVIQALKLICESCHPTLYKKEIALIRMHIANGISLHQAMRLVNHFPPMMIQMVKIGEESGKLEIMLNKIADSFEQEIERLNQRFTKLLEPLIMIGLGALIGIVVIAMYLPIFKLGNLTGNTY